MTSAFFVLLVALNVTRTNSLFEWSEILGAGHDEGAAAWGRFASLIETAKINGVEPFAYLKATLEKIASGHPANRIDDAPPLELRRNVNPKSITAGAHRLRFNMGASVKLRSDFDGPRIRELAKRSRDGAQARRLLALAEIYDGRRRRDAARLAGVGLQIIRDWV